MLGLGNRDVDKCSVQMGLEPPSKPSREDLIAEIGTVESRMVEKI